MYSHRQIVDLLRRIAESHWQIKSMGFGDYEELSYSPLLYSVNANNLTAPEFPMMWATMQGTTVTNNGGMNSILNKTYSIAIVDKRDRADMSLEEIFSDCEQICLDIISILQDDVYNDYFFVDKVATLTPVRGLTETDDSAVGWTFDITFRQPFTADRCAAPAAIPQPLPTS
jgi:hypothetical protein